MAARNKRRCAINDATLRDKQRREMGSGEEKALECERERGGAAREVPPLCASF